MQLAVSEFAIFGGVVPFPDDGNLVAPFGEMAIEAVGGDVELAIFKPFDGDMARIVGGVFDLAIGFHPVEDFSLLSPEGLGILDGGLIHGGVVALV